MSKHFGDRGEENVPFNRKKPLQRLKKFKEEEKSASYTQIPF